MSTTLAKNESGSLVGAPVVSPLTPVQKKRVAEFLDASWSDNTKKAYQSDWRKFDQWCQSNGHTSLPAAPETIVAYLSDMASDGCFDRRGVSKPCAYSSCARYKAAISTMHRLAFSDVPNYAPPTSDSRVRQILRGIRKKSKYRPEKATPLRIYELAQIVRNLDAHDRALLLIGWFGAFRSDELLKIRVKDVKIAEDGVLITVRETKTADEITTVIARGTDPSICPVEALMAYHRVRASESPKLFDTSVRGLGRLIKREVKALGLDPAQYSTHSLRAGFVTEAVARNVPLWAIKQQTKHKSDSTLMGYARGQGQGIDWNASKLLWDALK